MIKVGDEEIFLCGCGLSQDKPYCDGTHEKTQNEKNKVYFYDDKGNRVEMINFYSNQ